MKFAPLIVILILALSTSSGTAHATTSGVVNDTPTGVAPGRSIAVVSDPTRQQDVASSGSLGRAHFSSSLSSGESPLAVRESANDLSTLAVLLMGVLGLIWVRRQAH